MKDHVEGFEVDPHRMWRISEPSMQQGVGKQQMAELILNKRHRDRQYWEQSGTQHERGKTADQNASFTPSSKFSDCSLCPCKKPRAKLRKAECNQKYDSSEQTFGPDQSEHLVALPRVVRMLVTPLISFGGRLLVHDFL